LPFAYDFYRMNILQLHNRYQIVGGEEGVVQAEQTLLRAQGHRVQLLEVTNDDIVGLAAKASAAINAIYSRAARQRVLAAIDDFGPDLVHVHNFFPLLSPSVYDACRDRHIPVVQTLHNYRLACPKAMFFRDNQICEACLDQRSLLPAVVHGCYRASRPESAVVALMLDWHRRRGTWSDRVDAYIALTQFQKAKLVQAGLPAAKIHIKPNFVFAPPAVEAAVEAPIAAAAYILFVGRLAAEKGIAVLIEAYLHDPTLPPLKIVGDGPLRSALEQQAAELADRVTFLGRQSADQVRQWMLRASGLVFPSIWYEGFPLTIAEAFSCGLPVIVPALGSMAEIVQDGVTGYHFLPRDGVDLAAKIRQLMAQPARRQQMGQTAQQIYTAQYSPAVNYQQLLAIYRSAQAVALGA
jgi:glycosyltransferase involved in cell wall biosynthesis